jgi:uncharacterized membrane protein
VTKAVLGLVLIVLGLALIVLGLALVTLGLVHFSWDWFLCAGARYVERENEGK